MENEPSMVRDDPKLPDHNEEILKPNGMVGNSIPNCEIFTLLDGKNYLGVHVPLVFQYNLFS